MATKEKVLRKPSRETIMTTQGKIVIRAMTRREAIELRKLSRGFTPELGTDETLDLEEKMTALQEKCIIEGQEFLLNIEQGEYMEILNAIGELSREYKSKN